MAATKTRRTPRRERRPEERPHELLEAALAVFARHGYRNTRLDDVADAAGVTKGAIYHYFDTKEALLLSVIEHYQALAFGRVGDTLEDTRIPVSERIRVLIQNVFSVEEPRSRHLLALLIRGIAHEVPRVHDRWLREGPVRLWTLVARLVEEGKTRGEFRRDADGEVAARLLVSGLMLQLMWREHADEVSALGIDEKRLVGSAIELFLTGLRPPTTGARRHRGIV
jgi:AcrR family transcriptional regulator